MADPRDQAALQEIAARAQRGDFAGARAGCDTFLTAVSEPTRQSPVRAWLGLVEQRSGNLPAALVQYQLARQADRRNPHLILQLGLAHFEAGQSEQAEPLYREAIRLEPRLPLAHYNLGVLLQHKRDLPGARRAFEAALTHHPRFPEALNNLANTLVELHELVLAERCYRQAIALAASFFYAHHGLGLLLLRQLRRADALPCFQTAVDHSPAFTDGWLDLAECQMQMGDAAAAIASVERVLAINPEHAVARFRRALYTGEQPESAPPEMVERLYASMAPTFDEHLVDRLGYRLPALLAESLGPWLDRFTADGGGKPQVIDLGCGTGLFGAQIRPAAAHLAGVDLSPAMLDKARARGVYDELAAGDLVAFLQARDQDADLIVATDVLIYLGTLEMLFAAVAARLARGGVFAFSTETPDDLETGMRLQSSGRYAHASAYIEQLAAAHALRLHQRIATIIRTENAVPVKGFLFLLEKN